MMMKASHKLLLITILSAVLYSSAFLFIAVPVLPGILMIAALVLLWMTLEGTQCIGSWEFSQGWVRSIGFNTSWRKVFGYGFIWGVVLFGLHFIWLPILLCTKSQASGFQVVLLYSLIILCSGLLAGVFFLSYACSYNGFVKSIKDRGLFIFWGIALFFLSFWWFVRLINQFFWIPLGFSEGYPFVSPIIPLSKLPYVLSVLAIFSGPDTCKNIDTSGIGHIKSIRSEDPTELSQYFFKSIGNLQDQGKHLLVATESAYKFPLNKDREAEKFLASACKAETELLTGGYAVEDEKWYQVVYQLNNHGIEKKYPKSHLIPFVEKMPFWFSKISCMRKMFLEKRNEFSTKPCERSYDEKTLDDNVFALKNNRKGIVSLCSEIFFTNEVPYSIKSITPDKSAKKPMVFFLVNDSWFVDYFRKIMETVSQVTATKLGAHVCYVTSQECVLLCPHGCRRVISS